MYVGYDAPAPSVITIAIGKYKAVIRMVIPDSKFEALNFRVPHNLKYHDFKARIFAPEARWL